MLLYFGQHQLSLCVPGTACAMEETVRCATMPVVGDTFILNGTASHSLL
jgi:hypothetical protein